ncbi:nucleotidyltransferase family protein [Natronobiforma cellulositropha]|uniref:nucleotidyltransferase family protein n=1 Tax=Natronobiforma cellulositropha TaxID=1679076 RepID=UPI0021D5E618|nr:nucleotidyltransferase domain-containing protein [Natronobiforma cellulositropha]
MDERDESSASIESTLRAVCRRHPVRFALLFGSRTREPAVSTGPRDVDLAVEFESLRPADFGYSDVYLALLDDLESRLGPAVDLVDVHSMPPQFAGSVFDHGRVVYGPSSRGDELAALLSGDPVSKEQARARIDTAVERLYADGDSR